MKNEPTKGTAIIRAIASGNVRQLSDATGQSDGIAYEDMIATFHYITGEKVTIDYYDFPQLQEENIAVITDGLDTATSAGLEAVSLEALKMLAVLSHYYEKLKGANQLHLIDKYRDHGQTAA